MRRFRPWLVIAGAVIFAAAVVGILLNGRGGEGSTATTTSATATATDRCGDNPLRLARGFASMAVARALAVAAAILLVAGLSWGSAWASAPPPAVTAKCRDGSYSLSHVGATACSGHGGVVAWWLGAGGTTTSTTVFVIGSAPSAAMSRFPNCRALNARYPHGVGRPGAFDRTKSGVPVTNFRPNNALYLANRGLDRDKDGIACEEQ